MRTGLGQKRLLELGTPTCKRCLQEGLGEHHLPGLSYSFPVHWVSCRSQENGASCGPPSTRPCCCHEYWANSSSGVPPAPFHLLSHFLFPLALRVSPWLHTREPAEVGTAGEAAGGQRARHRSANKRAKPRFEAEQGWVPCRHPEVPDQLFKLSGSAQREIRGPCSLPAAFTLAFQSTFTSLAALGTPPPRSARLPTPPCVGSAVCMRAGGLWGVQV